MSGLIHKYMHTKDDNNFKKKSLEDNVYFTLRDIFWNSNSSETCMTANEYNDQLTNNVCFEDRTDDFQYANVLYDVNYLEKLLRWLNLITIHYFDLKDGDNNDEYMKFDDWRVRFEELKCLLKKRLNEITLSEL